MWKQINKIMKSGRLDKVIKRNTPKPKKKRTKK